MPYYTSTTRFRLHQGHEFDAGWDIPAAQKGLIQPSDGAVAVDTGINIRLNRGSFAMITPRSGLALKGLTIVNSPGIMDADYRGELRVILANLGAEPIAWNAGDRLAQLVLVPHNPAERWHYLGDDPELLLEIDRKRDEHNTRGDQGFGSTGTRSPEDIESDKELDFTPL